MTYDEWVEKYKPIENKIVEHAPFDGYMFETYDDELKAVQDAPVNNVWTLVDGEEEDIWLAAGKWRINRIGYMICEKPWTGEPADIRI